MYRKIVSCFLLLAFITFVTSSCSDNAFLPSKEYSSIHDRLDLSPEEYEEIGQIHNEAMGIFASKHNLLSTRKLEAEDFSLLAAESINEVFSKHNKPVRINARDVKEILGYFVSIRHAGAMDFFSDDVSIISLQRTVDYFIQKGILTVGAGKEYLHVLGETDCESLNNNKAGRYSEPYQCKTDNPLRDKVFINVLKSSREFWAGLYEHPNQELLSGIVHMSKNGLDSTSFYDLREKGKDISDVVGAVLGLYILGGYGAIVVGYLASIAFTTAYDNPDWRWVSPYPHGR